MAGRHEHIKWCVIRNWSEKQRGRLYCMNQGMAIPINGDNPIWFGPLKRKFKGFPDLFGFEKCTFYYYDNYQYRKIIVPVFTVIEVKVPPDTVRPVQKAVISALVKFGCRAYIAIADDITDDGYILRDWKKYNEK